MPKANLLPFINQKFNRLLIISILPPKKRKDNENKNIHRVLCKCDCGVTKTYTLTSIKNGHIKSCGCLKSETTRGIFLKHGLSNTPLYLIWMGIKQRCSNPHHKSYKNYGARGIKVCPTWNKDFIPFYEWAMMNGWIKGLDIDRINNDRHYSPKNCRIVTRLINSRNKRDTLRFLYNNEIKTLYEWTKILGLKYITTYMRIKNGMDFKTAVETPKKINQYK